MVLTIFGRIVARYKNIIVDLINKYGSMAIYLKKYFLLTAARGRGLTRLKNPCKIVMVSISAIIINIG